MRFYEKDSVGLQRISRAIKEQAVRLGFVACGITPVRLLAEDAAFMKNWLAEGRHGSMSYLERYAEERENPGLLLENARSIIVVLFPYQGNRKQPLGAPKIAKYAYGSDYHYVIKQKLQQLLDFIHHEITPVNGRAFCDTAPVFERRWAQQAGLGWIGTNKCLIHPEFGSFVMIGGLISDLEVAYDQPMEGDCGNCGLCVAKCPTHALSIPGRFDATRCISYLTIESKEEIPEVWKDKLRGYVAGCDICQDVCPWNRKKLISQSSIDAEQDVLWQMTREEWRLMNGSLYKRMVRKSALNRIPYKKMRRNLLAIDPLFFGEHMEEE